MKNLFYSALAFAATSPLALLAEEGGTSGSTSTDAAGLGAEVATKAQDALTGLLDTVAPVIVEVVVAGLAIWGGIALVGIIKRGFSAGKGR